MARMPFARYLARIVGETPAPYVIEAMEWLWGEWAVRQTVQARKAKRVRDYYLFVRRAFRRCDEAVGCKILIDEGHRLRVYVPYGKHWYRYSVRRLRENPQIAGYAFKALCKRASAV